MIQTLDSIQISRSVGIPRGDGNKSNTVETLMKTSVPNLHITAHQWSPKQACRNLRLGDLPNSYQKDNRLSSFHQGRDSGPREPKTAPFYPFCISDIRVAEFSQTHQKTWKFIERALVNLERSHFQGTQNMYIN